MPGAASRAALVGALAVLVTGACAPTSFASFVAQDPEFGHAWAGKAPVSSQSDLGKRVASEQEIRHGRVLEAREPVCFFLKVDRGRSLDHKRIKYGSLADIEAELEAVVATANVKGSRGSTVQVTVRDLVEHTMVGIPNAGCLQDEDSTSLRVITAELVAGHARLELSTRSGLTLAGDVPVAQGVAIEPKAGWTRTADGLAEGRDLVIAVMDETLRIDATTERISLGFTPKPGHSIPLPKQLDRFASVIIEGYDAEVSQLGLRIATTAGTSVTEEEHAARYPAGPGGICGPGTWSLAAGQPCTVWLQPGNRGFAISWEKGPQGEILAKLSTYATS
ncbi:hypothetical protein [Paraliomyxa miuraensis]|uniref:hypothetical protein n=1 Tax=Paraliomyxa miuraensis TaxID=376150 RepID=UPI002252EF74|nr:hypothetical protein [Paraliomyxa miuraensis]MCX4243091.1 hypothetical protein [Paraliomyxa miuraensis]